MTYRQSCPRCGHVFTGRDRDHVANEMVEHASAEHGHTLTHEHALNHIDREDSDESEH